MKLRVNVEKVDNFEAVELFNKGERTSWNYGNNFNVRTGWNYIDTICRIN